MLACLAALLILAGCGAPPDESRIDSSIASLTELSIDALRTREFGSRLIIEEAIESVSNTTYMASYVSDGLRIYSRIDLPDIEAPDAGYPVVVFIHGWAGIDAAPDLDFFVGEASNYGQMIATYVDAGFAVFTPGFRGHGTVDGIQADGIEYMRAWDNGSYLSPVFYAIDVLNLVDSLDKFALADLDFNLDLDNINLVAHSQGGDVALIALAISGEGSSIRNDITAASIWSGCFPSRFTQLETYYPMQSSSQAFMSGDGTWNGTDTGADGSVNTNFVFGYPPDWIDTPNPGEWTWQKDSWPLPTVAEALKKKLDEMYSAINAQVADIGDATYLFEPDNTGKSVVTHDPRIAAAMAWVGSGAGTIPSVLANSIAAAKHSVCGIEIASTNPSL